MKFALALLIAVHFWSDRGVHVPCHPVAIEGRDAVMPQAYGRAVTTAANVSQCAVYISEDGIFERHAGPNWYCMDIVHEVGHIAGLQHTRTGVMAAEVDFGDMPYDCQHWRAFRRNL